MIPAFSKHFRPVRAARWVFLTFLAVCFAFSPSSARGEESKRLIVVLDDSRGASLADPEDFLSEAVEMLFGLLPEDLSAGVVSAGETPAWLWKPATGWDDDRARDLGRRVKHMRRQAPEADFEGVFDFLEQNTDAYDDEDSPISTRILLVMLSEHPAEPDNEFLHRLGRRDLTLHVLTLADPMASGLWRRAAGMKDGLARQASEARDLPFSMLRMFLTVCQLQQLPVENGGFMVDRFSSRVVFLAAPAGDEELVLISPDNIRYRPNAPGSSQRDTARFRRYGDLQVIHLNAPASGMWGVKGHDPKRAFALTRSRHSIEILLSRRVFAQDEMLVVAAYLARDGNVTRLPAPVQDIGVRAELLDEEEDGLFPTPLEDDGRPPDQFAADGVFSGMLSLEGRSGIQSLRVFARSNALSRSRLEHLKVFPENGMTLIQPKESVPTGKPFSVLVQLHPLIPTDAMRSFVVDFGRESYDLNPVEGHPGLYRAEAPAFLGHGRVYLTLTRTMACSTLTSDRQSVRVPLIVQPPPEKTKAPIPWKMPALVGLVLTLFAGGGLFFRKYRALKRELPVEPLKEILAPEPAPVSEPAPEGKSEPESEEEPEDEPEPLSPAEESKKNEGRMLDNVSQRIEEVMEAHVTEGAKTKSSRLGLNQEDLDNDSDSASVQDMNTQVNADIEELLKRKPEDLKSAFPETGTPEDDSNEDFGGEAKTDSREAVTSKAPETPKTKQPSETTERSEKPEEPRKSEDMEKAEDRKPTGSADVSETKKNVTPPPVSVEDGDDALLPSDDSLENLLKQQIEAATKSER